MTFERTQDLESIRTILSEPRCYRRIVNDSAPSLEAFGQLLTKTLGIEYVMALDRGEPLAIFLLCGSRQPDTAEVHFSMLPENWGPRAIQIVSGFLAWVWQSTQLNLLIAKVPSYNRLALRIAGRVGFEYRFTRCAMGTRRGQSFDLIQVEATRPA